MDNKELAGNLIYSRRDILKYSRPQNIYNKLIQEVTGQDETAKKLSLVCAQRDAGLSNVLLGKDFIRPSKIILSGDSGCGKSYLIHKLAQVTNSILVRIDISGYTGAGWKGNDITDLFNRDVPSRIDELYRADNHVESDTTRDHNNPYRSIIFIDEIDKITKSAATKNDHAWVVQNELLVMLDEYTSSLSVAHNYDVYNTVLWVFAGAFTQFRNEKAADNSKAGVGFGAREKTEVKPGNYKMSLDDYKDAGILAELMGRIGHCSTLNAMTEKDYHTILDHPVNSPLIDMVNLSVHTGHLLELNKQTKDKIVKSAMSMGLGVRGLRIAAENILYNDINWSE